MSKESTISKIVDKVTGVLGGEGEESVHTRKGSDPHAEFEQSHPAVNKDEPKAFANPMEAGAKKPSEEKVGKPTPVPTSDRIQEGSSESCVGNVHSRPGDSPHAEFEQCGPAVNKEEPIAFANPCESGAKEPSKDVTGERMP